MTQVYHLFLLLEMMKGNFDECPFEKIVSLYIFFILLSNKIIVSECISLIAIGRGIKTYIYAPLFLCSFFCVLWWFGLNEQRVTIDMQFLDY